ncbi:hypothetical protein VST7929_00028 [Vibrio stylophorae]|uniref:4Fe-4S ferredoxin-type domain-containing protein n=1 Tax=Vibrio stylophorae TaxID=659351 RepID=A0ABM8ZQP4_9VIBR|nr:cytochrome c oxidase accessory protein CcoG [Vibrio stylophorae]CAH0532217.1 hypothetical protein VST7929_00028 [Vibrio stylophorae]
MTRQHPPYVRASSGHFQRLRRYLGGGLIALFVLLPWLSWQGRQAILLSFSERQFHLFSITLWPQDFILLALLFAIAAFALFAITTWLGRVWCGFTCPQTVWTFIFLWFEEKLEGPANKRKRQDGLPWSLALYARKTLKHMAWWLISLLTGATFIGYFVPIHSLFYDLITLNLWDSRGGWVLFFAVCTYGNAGWMRSIMCTHMCPYARFQSVMYDDATITVSYDQQRGEPRGKQRKGEQNNLGDCVDCNLCVEVCPPRIDIRQGLQYECIDCGACVDACNHTMQRFGKAPNLIGYHAESKQKLAARPKLLGYALITLIALLIFSLMINARTTMTLTVIRDRQQLYQYNNQGLLENSYQLVISNKTQQTHTYQLSLMDNTAWIWQGPKTLKVEANARRSILITLAADPETLNQQIYPITFVLQQADQQVTHHSRFISDYQE